MTPYPLTWSQLQVIFLKFAVEKNYREMEKMMEYHAAFERAMDEDKVYLDLDFEDICSALGAPSEALDRHLRSELGYGGRELVDFYRSKFC